MMRLFLLCVLLVPLSALADVSCDGVDDDFTTNLGLSTFLTDTTGTLVLTYMPTGTPAYAYSSCPGGEFLVSDAPGGPWLGIYRHGNYDFAVEDRLCIYNWDGSNDFIPVAYSVGVRTHLVWVHSGGQLLFYKDGALVTSIPSGTTPDVSHPLRVCGGAAVVADNGQPGQGRIIALQTYAVALSAAQIASAGTSAVQNVIPVPATGQWNFDDCTPGASANGVTFLDRSGNARPMTGSSGANGTGATCLGSSIPYAWGVW
jgi:hypothetical protein